MKTIDACYSYQFHFAPVSYKSSISSYWEKTALFNYDHYLWFCFYWHCLYLLLCLFLFIIFFDLGNILQFFDTASNTLSNKRVAKTSQILHHFRFSKFLEPFVCLKFQKNLLTIYWSEDWLVSEVALIFFGLGCFWIIFSRD